MTKRLITFIQAVEKRIRFSASKDYKDKNKNMMQLRIWQGILNIFLNTWRIYLKI